EIKDLWEKMERSKGKKKLKTMTIDVISTLVKDTPINQLVNNGFRTIYDIENQEPVQLMRINIREKNAYLIYNAVSKIKDSVYQQAIRINQDNLSKENIELLAAIYKKWELSNVIETLKVDFEELNKVVRPDIETIKKQKGLIGSLFQSKFEKEEVKHINNMNNIKEKLDSILHFTVNRDELILHFVQENASYYTELEKVTGFKQVEIPGHLPAEIAETVNNFPLDTTDLDVTLRHY